jgi:hypothetical protein
MSTTIKTNLKPHLAELFTQQNYIQACIDLEEFSFESFENILFSIFTSIDYKEHKHAFSQTFFCEYLPNSKYFEELIQSPRRRELFEILFEYPSLKCPKLYRRLCLDFPEAVLIILKRHRVPFLHKEHFIQISSALAEPDIPMSIFEFGEKMLHISIFESMYYHNAAQLTKQIIDKSLEEIFGMVGLWLHYFTWDLSINKNNSDISRKNETNAVLAINTFLSHILYYKDKAKNIDFFDPIKHQTKVINSNCAIPPNYEIFLAWFKWKSFSGLVDEFCFDDDCSIEFDEGGLIISHNQKSKEEFIYTDLKYYHYELDIQEIDKIEINNIELDDAQKWFIKEIGPLYTKETRQAYNEFITEIYIEQYGLNIEKLISFSLSKIICWRIGLKHALSEGIKNRLDWKTILIQLSEVELKTISDQLPFMVMTESNIYDVNKVEYQEYFTKEILEKCVNACLLNLDDYKSEKFNRFEPQINLFHTIWYKINNKTYCFPQISASMNTHSFFSNLALIVHRKEKTQKKKANLTTQEMEKFISNLAEEKGFLVAKNRHYNFEKNGEKFSGEVDAILFDGKKILAIEFKRSALRSSLAEINYEKEIVLEGAARQLDRFKQYVKTNPKELNNKFGVDDKLNFESIPIEGLIITTNFEHDHQLIRNKYKKISWIEWLWIINDIKNGDSIDEILIRVKNNTYWSEVIGI